LFERRGSVIRWAKMVKGENQRERGDKRIAVKWWYVIGGNAMMIENEQAGVK